MVLNQEISTYNSSTLVLLLMMRIDSQLSFSKINQSLYVNMQGPSEFGVSGKLEKWDVKSQLKNITVPTLVIGSKYDSMDPEHMKWMSKEVKNGTFLYCPNGGHMSMYDDQAIYIPGLMKFMKDVNGEK